MLPKKVSKVLNLSPLDILYGTYKIPRDLEILNEQNATQMVTSRKEENLMSELDYSLHLGSDKNRKNIFKQNGKNNLSRTTSLSNNAIQNVRQSSKVDKHNYRKYNGNQELIEIVRGTSFPLDDVKELYLSEFEEARLEYNSKQSRPSRMIDNYFYNVSNNEKKELAC